MIKILSPHMPVHVLRKRHTSFAQKDCKVFRKLTVLQSTLFLIPFLTLSVQLHFFKRRIAQPTLCFYRYSAEFTSLSRSKQYRPRRSVGSHTLASRCPFCTTHLDRVCDHYHDLWGPPPIRKKRDFKISAMKS